MKISENMHKCKGLITVSYHTQIIVKPSDTKKHSSLNNQKQIREKRIIIRSYSTSSFAGVDDY